MLEYKPLEKNSLDYKSLKYLVKEGEGTHVEFKLKTNHPEKIVKEIVAFSNTKGGKLLIGVSDDKQIKGLKFAEEDSFILKKAIEKFIYPQIDYVIEKVRLDDEKEVLVFEIPESPMKPHYVDLDGTLENRKAYIRVADKSIQASKEVREILKGQRKGKELRFVYGEKERELFKFLSEHGYITISKFSQLVGIPKKQASRTLVLLTLTNVLKVLPMDIGEDHFVEV
jgi:predicted HTH transcriptional regulator